eukprot:5266404-Amphidinium_carterae.1
MYLDFDEHLCGLLSLKSIPLAFNCLSSHHRVPKKAQKATKIALSGLCAKQRPWVRASNTET